MASENLFVVLRTAATPAEAKVLAALLQGEGIRAQVDGEQLADEIAISRRVMNLNGVHVRVPHDQLEQARQVLEAAVVDDDELAAQALAAAPQQLAPGAATTAREPRGGRATMVVAVLGCAAAALFFGLWMDSAAMVRAFSATPRGGLRSERTADGWRWVDPLTDTVRTVIVDRDGNGIPEITRWFDTDGRLMSVATDADQDGVAESSEDFHGDGTRLQWTRDDARGEYRLVVLGADGAVRSRQHFDGRGYVDDR